MEPTYAEDNSDHLIHFLLHRQHTDDDLFLFVKPETRDLEYEVYFNEGDKPAIEDNQYIYRTELKGDNWTIEDGYRLHLPSETLKSAGTIWIALRPVLGEQGEVAYMQIKWCLLNLCLVDNISSGACLVSLKD